MSTDEKQKIQEVAAVLHKQAPDFRAFAHRICELFFDDGGGPVEYDEFIEAGVATGVITERPFNPDDPARSSPRRRVGRDGRRLRQELQVSADMQTIRLTLAEFSKHIDHKVTLDFGRTSLRGEGTSHSYSIWCDTCEETISTVVVVKR